MEETASITPTVVLLVVVVFVLLGGAWVLRSRRSETISGQEEPRLRRPLPPGTDPELAALINAGQTIAAIKLVRDRSGIGLKEAKDYVTAIGAGQPAELPSRTTPGSTSKEVNDDELMQLVSQGNKIEAIKLVRERTGAGLKEAKDYVEGLMSDRPAPLPSVPAVVESQDLDTEVRQLLDRGLVIEAVKLVRERTGKGLKEAKDHVDQLARQ